MKILWITPRLPEPPDSGGKMVTFNTLKYLALRGHRITLCPLVNENLKEASKLEEFIDLKITPFSLEKSTGRFTAIFTIFSTYPYVISKYWSQKAWKFMAGILSNGSYHLVHCDHLHMAGYGLRAMKEFKIPALLTSHNVEAVLWERVSQIGKNPVRKAYCKLQWLKMRSYEAQVIRGFSKCIMISPKDAEQMQKLNPAIDPVIVPPGVDTDYFKPLDVKEEPGSVIFVGTMDWLPNIDGVLWFYKRVWPRVKEGIPKAKLYIVGRRPAATIRRLAANRDVIVTGWLEDIRPHMARSQVFIVPLRAGSGIRIKILNALAMEKAVVSTPLGCEGIKARNGKDILLAEKPGNFAKKVVWLLQDESKRKELGKAGVKLVKKYYRWEEAAERIEKVYQQVVS